MNEYLISQDEPQLNKNNTKELFTSLKGAAASTGIGLLLLAFGVVVNFFGKSEEGIEFKNKTD